MLNRPQEKLDARRKRSLRRSLARKRKRLARRIRFEQLEDRRVLAGLDYGDAPDTTAGTGPGDYQTLPEHGGPSHEVSASLYLGSWVYGEDLAYADFRATGDDIDRGSGDDEDGIRIPGIDLNVAVTSSPVVSVTVTNTHDEPAVLYGWIDVNGDGVFDNARERASRIIDYAFEETVNLEFPEIITGFTGKTYARFRIGLASDLGAANPTGAAGIGEVEDYTAEVTVPIDSGRNPLVRESGIDNTLPDNWLGSSYAVISDLDGNGVTELAVGAPRDDTAGFNAGAVHIQYRNEAGFVVRTEYVTPEMAGLEQPHIQMQFGTAVASVGDVDKNGVIDLIVSWTGDQASRWLGGVCLLLLDKDDEGSVVVSDSVRFDSNTAGLGPFVDYAYFGASLTSAGDLNGDGVMDFAITSAIAELNNRHRRVHVLLMNEDHSIQSTQVFTAGEGVIPEGSFGTYGWGTSIAGIGDVDGDLIPDLAVGHPSGGNWGIVDILFMNSDGSVRAINRINTPWNTPGPGWGHSLAGLGDVSGDLVPDIAVGSKDSQTGYTSNSYLALNRDGTVQSVAIGDPDANGESIEVDVLTESFRSARFRDSIKKAGGTERLWASRPPGEGRSVASLGSLDNYHDSVVAIGFPGDDIGGTDRGAVHVSYRMGLTESFIEIASDKNGFGPLDDFDRFGTYVTAAGDLDVDGADDLFVSAPGDDNNRGTIYTLNLNPDASVKKHAKLNIDFTPFSGSEFGVYMDVAGDMNGDGIDDLVVSSRTADGFGYQLHYLLLNSDRTGGTLRPIATPPGVDSSWGSSVAGLGDVDGDSIPDLVVGAPTAGPDNRGTVDVLLMNLNGTVKAATTIGNGIGGLQSADDRFEFGTSVTSIEDMDRDGIREMAVGGLDFVDIFFLTAEGGIERQHRYAPFTNTEGWTISSLTSLGDTDGDNNIELVSASERIQIDDFGAHLSVHAGFPYRPTRSAGGYFAHALTDIGDLDQDGFDDVAVGAPGKNAVHILFGPGVTRVTEISSEGLDLNVASEGRGGLDVVFSGEDEFGGSIANIGDLDSDGITDLAVTGAGSAYILFLNSDGTVRSTAEVDSGDGFVDTVTGLGDLDGDGVVDLALGAPDRPFPPRDFGGAVYIVLMNSDGSIKHEEVFDSTTPGLPDTMRRFGESLATVGDINQDGIPDLAVTETGDYTDPTPSTLHVLLLNSDGTLLEDRDIFSRNGTFQNATLVPVGDIDGNAVPDLVVYAQHGTQTVLFNADGTVKEQIPGDYKGEISATPIRDVNGDGVKEILVRRDNSIGLKVYYSEPAFTLVGDFGDAPDSTDGTSPWNYNTLVSDDGPIHGVLPDLRLGDTVGIDEFSNPSTAADSDDDDGVVDPVRDLFVTGVPSIELKYTNQVSSDAKIYGWLDANFDGVFEESERVVEDAPNGDDLSVTLVFPAFPPGLAGTTYARFRLSSDEAASSPTGYARNGEVEDYRVTIQTPASGLGATSTRIPGHTTYNRFGASVAWLGDLDSNGFDDYAVGSSQRDQVSIVFMGPGEIVHHYVHHSSGSEDRFNSFGASVANIGDLNNDGVTDIAVGAWGEKSGDVESGAVHVIFLNPDGTQKSRTKIKSDLAGAPTLANGDRFGASVAAIGDVNNDEIVDLVVGASADSSLQTKAGAVYVLFMNADGTVASHSKIGHSEGGGPALQGFESFGESVAGGDWKGDGTPYLAVGAPKRDTSVDGHLERDMGAVYLIGLNDQGVGVETTRLDRDSGLPLEAGDRFGSSIVMVGDLDGVGFGDLAVGAVGHEPGGAVHLVMIEGDGAVHRTHKMADKVGGGPDLETSNAWFGASIAAIPDPDNSGRPQLAIGSPLDSNGGSVHLTWLTNELLDFGDAPTEAHGTEVEVASYTAVGSDVSDNFGSSIALLGDINGDNIDDLAVGSRRKNQVSVLMMNADGTVQSRTMFSGQEDPSTSNGLSFGYSIAAIGDLDDDGITELAIGADGNDFTGAVHLVYPGSDGLPKRTTKIGNDIGGGPALENGARFGASVASIGDLNGDGIDDLAVGATRDTNGGAVYILFMNDDDTFDSYTKIGSNMGGMPQISGGAVGFGTSVAAIGDVDGDDVTELAVGVPTGNSGYGTTYLLFMNTDGTVRKTTEINNHTGIPLAYGTEFGTSVTAIGDLNADGISEIAIGAVKDDTGGSNRGAVHVVFLNADGSVRNSSKIGDGVGGGPALLNHGLFGSGVALINDVNGDDIRDLAVGSMEDYLGGRVHVLHLDPILYGSRDTGGDVPSHGFSSALFLGSSVDAESRQYFDVAAAADDEYGAVNDADGLINPSQLSNLVAGVPVVVDMIATNLSGTDATLYGWIDFNGNNVFDSGERASNSVPDDSIGDVYRLTFPAQSTIIEGDTFARFRLSTAASETAPYGAARPTGPASDGEVEDYSTAIQIIDTDYGDAPDSGAGTDFGNYNTLSTDSGPSHIVNPAIYLGSGVDVEFEAAPTATARSDKDDGVVDQSSDLTLIPGDTPTVTVSVTNNTLTDAKLYGWIDYSVDGVFDQNPATEQATSVTLPGFPADDQLTIPAGFSGEVEVAFPEVPGNAVGTTYARFRLSTDVTMTGPTGPAADGEVEDYQVKILANDYGDAPSSYNLNNVLENDPPSHRVIDGLTIGATVDRELSGFPTPRANSDDRGLADEDGLVDPIRDLTLVPGLPQSVELIVNVGNDIVEPVYLYGWIDVNQDGSFDSSEMAQKTVGQRGTSTVTLDIPVVPNTAEGKTYARFRLTTDAGIGPTGAASNGEVEDYTATIVRYDFGDAPDTGYVASRGNYATEEKHLGPYHLIDHDLTLGAKIDVEDDASPSSTAAGDDADGVDDEDGLENPVTDLRLTRGIAPRVDLKVKNGTGAVAWLAGWIDFNANGDFEDWERETRKIEINHNFNSTVTLEFDPITTTYVGETYARFRVSTDKDAAESSTGAAPDGEVEDYLVNVVYLDYGDAPDTQPDATRGNYRTRDADEGPSHSIVDGLYMGSGVDNELDSLQYYYNTTGIDDGTPRLSANGDDQSGSTPDDEDGLVDPSVDLKLVVDDVPVVRVTATNQTGRAATLYGWIDINGDGKFADNDNERVSTQVNDGEFQTEFTLEFRKLRNPRLGTTYARFRLSTDPNVQFATGHVDDGEVEDYVVTIEARGDGVPPITGETVLQSTKRLATGAGDSDEFGTSIASMGDVDRNDITDILVGAPWVDVPGDSWSHFHSNDPEPSGKDGSIHVLLMNDNETVKKRIDSAVDWRYSGARYGASVAAWRAQDERGPATLIVGATGVFTDTWNSGCSWGVCSRGNYERGYNGATYTSTVSTAGTVSAATISLSGHPGAQLAYSSSVIGDFNDDNIRDFAIGVPWPDSNGAAGEVLVYRMNADGSTSTRTSIQHGAEHFGIAVAGIESINGDQVPDIAVGTRENGGRGSVYLVKLNRSGLSLGTPVRIPAPSTNVEAFGSAIVDVGDIDDNGANDYIIGAPLADGGRGAIYVVQMADDAKSVKGTTKINFNTQNIGTFSRGDQFGRALAVASNKNGVVKLAVGSPGYGADNRGAIYLVTLEFKVTPATLEGAIENLPENTAELETRANLANIGEWIDAVESLPEFPRPNEVVRIVLNLEAGNYSGRSIIVPSGYQLVIDGRSTSPTFTGASPALTVISGDVVVTGGVTFTNDTDAPTILVQGGSLTLRDATVEETSTADRPAIEITGGVVDLGTTDDPGGNTIIITGAGDLLHNSTTLPISALGNTFQQDGDVIASNFDIEDEIFHALDDANTGLATYVADNVFVKIDEGPRELDLALLTTDLDVAGATFTITSTTGGDALILADDRTVRFIALDDGPADFSYHVLVDEQTIATRQVNFLANNVAPTVDLGVDRTVDEGSSVTFAGAFTDPGSGDTHTFLWQVESSNGQVIPDNDTQDFSFLPVNDGEYTVTYTVTDDDGGVHSDTVVVTVKNVAPSVAVDEVTITADEADTASNSGTFSDPGADAVTLSASVGAVTDNGDGTWTWSWNTSDGPDESQSVTISATDSDGAVTSVDFDLTVNNVAPSLTIDTTAVVIDEDTSFVKTITASDVPTDTVAVMASLGTITDTGGGSWSWSYDAVDDLDVTSVTITATDEDGGLASVAFDLTVTNVAPQFEQLNSSSGSLITRSDDGLVTITGQFGDVGTLDTHNVVVDWGDGSSAQLLTNVNQSSDEFTAEHLYKDGGIYTVAVTLTDDDGESRIATTSAVVTGIGVVDRTLYIIGTDGKDHVTIKANGKKDELKVDAKLNQGGRHGASGHRSDRGHDGSSESRVKIKKSFVTSSIDRIVTHLFGGDDHYEGGRVDVPISQFVFGGDGRDKLRGGHGNDVLIGGNGRDDLKGERGSDILIGGIGKDKLKGGRGNDLLIGGSTEQYDLASLEAALTNWTDGDLAAALIDLGALTDDGDQDELNGEQGLDELIGGIGDKLRPRRRSWWRC